MGGLHEVRTVTRPALRTRREDLTKRQPWDERTNLKGRELFTREGEPVFLFS